MGLRLQAEFKSDQGTEYTIQVYDANYASSVQAVECGADGFTMTYENQNGKIYSPIIASRVSFTLFFEDATNEAFITDLLSANEDDIQVKILKGTDLFWTGVMLPDIVEHLDEYYPFAFEFSAVDGLGRLQTTDYADSGDYYSGYATLWQIVQNCLDKVGTKDFWGSSDNYLMVSLNYFEEEMNVSGDTNPLVYTRVNQIVFRKNDDETQEAEFFSCHYVLEQILFNFGARIFQADGSWWIVSFNEYDDAGLRLIRHDKTGAYISHSLGFNVDETIDQSTKARLRGVRYSYFPALQEFKLLYSHKNVSNLLFGVQWNHSPIDFTNTELYTIGEVDDNNGLAKLKFTGTLEHFFQHIDTIDPPEPFFFGVFHFWRFQIKVGSYYLKRNFLPFNSPFNTVFETPTWTTDPSFYYIRSQYVTEPYVSFFDQVEFITPALIEQGELTISLEYDSTYEENGNELVVDLGGVGSPPRILYWLNNPVMTVLADGTNGNQDGNLIYITTNNLSNNTLKDSFTTIIGDGPTEGSPGHLETSADGTTWEPSSAWRKDDSGVTSYKLGQLVTKMIVAAQSYPIKKLSGTIFGTDIFPYSRLVVNSEYYAFLGGSFDANLEHFTGEWYIADYNETNVIVNDPGTQPPKAGTTYPATPNSPPIGPPGGGSGGYGTGTGSGSGGLNISTVLNTLIEIKVGEGTTSGTSGVVQLNAPLSTDILSGQTLTVIHPGTGATQVFTVSEDVAAGSTSIPVVEPFDYSFPIGSWIAIGGSGTGGAINTSQQVVENVFEVTVGSGGGASGCPIEAVACSVQKLEYLMGVGSGTNWSAGALDPFFVVPAHFDGLSLSQVGINIATIGSGGTGSVTIKKNGTTIDTVDVSAQATRRAVYSVTETALATNDLLTFEIASVQSTPAKGLMIELFVDDHFIALQRFEVGLTGTEACLVMYLKANRNSLTGTSPFKRLADSANNNNRGEMYTGKALEFDGVDDYVDVGDTESDVKTIVFWCRPDSDTEKIIDLDGGTTTIEIVSGVLTLTGFTSPTPYVNGINDNVVTANEWNMIAITTSTAIDVNDLDIGRVGATYYDGELTSLRLYSVVLTFAQISSLYSYPEMAVPGAAFWSSLKGYWTLDHANNNFGLALDSTGNHHGVISGATYTDTLNGIVPQYGFHHFSQLLYFNNNSYVEVADAATLDLTTTGTISVWFITKDITDAGFLVCKNPDASGYTLKLSSLRAVFTGGGATALQSSVLSANTKYHLVVTWNATSATIYLNGTSDATGSIDSVGSTAQSLTIGGDNAAANLAEALVFEVAIWNSVLSAANITALYNQSSAPSDVAAADLVGYWNNKGLRTWTDGSTNGNDGTPTGTTETLFIPEGRASGKDGFARTLTDYWNSTLKLTGTEYALVTDADPLDVTGEMSLYCWIRPRAVGSLQYVIEKAGAYYLRINADNTLTFALYSSASANTFTTTATVSQDTWVLFSVSYDGSTVKLYLDGALVDTNAFTGLIDTNTNNLYIGRDAAGSNYLNGYVDDISLYNCGKSSTEINDFYIDTEPAHRDNVLPSSLFIGDPDLDTIIGDPTTDEGLGS